MSAAKVPTVAPIYGSPCAEKLMSVALSVRCSRLFKRVLVASTYPTTSRHIEEAHEKWNSIGFSSRLHFKGPEEAYEDSFLEKDDLISEWKKSIDASSVISALADLPWTEEHSQLMTQYNHDQSMQKRRQVRNRLVGAYSSTFVRDIIASSDLLVTGSRGVTMLTSRALHVVKTRKPVSDSVAQDVQKLFENAIGLGLAGLQSQIDTVRRSANHWYEKNKVELDYMADVSSAAEQVPTNLHLFDRLRLKAWDRTINDSMQFHISDDHQLAAEASRWGVAYTSLIYSWLSSLRWPQASTGDDGVGITWYELAVNFWLKTQQAPLISLAKGNDPQQIVNIVEHPAYDASHYTFAKMIFAFAGAVEHAAYFYGSAILPLNHRIKAKSLFQLGANVFREGLPVRPVMQKKQHKTMAMIDSYIQQHQHGNNMQFHEYPNIPRCAPIFHSRFSDIEGDTFQSWQTRYTRRKKFIQAQKRNTD